MMNHLADYSALVNRRQFFRNSGTGLGVAALASLLGREAFGDSTVDSQFEPQMDFAPKAKRVIYISLVGAPSQFETFDYKPDLEFNENIAQFLEDSGQQLTGMTSGQSHFPVAPSFTKFQQYGQSGTWVSDLLPWTAQMVDDLCIVRSMYTDAINHEPANQLIYTGSMQQGKASIGSWLSYGMGSANDNLPAFVVLHATYSNPGANAQAVSNRLWSSGFLPGEHAGVTLRTKGDPILYLKNAPGIDESVRRHMLDGLNALNHHSYQQVGDPEIQVRMQQAEMAFRMQSSVPELSDMSGEPEHILDLYGPESRQPGTFAYSALMARRLAERGVRFTQIFHRGWDQHNNLPNDIVPQCRDVDQGCYGLIQDLKQRGMLEDTLVVWAGEFGRTVYSQGQLTSTNYGRDHHPRAFSIWMAGGGVKPGLVFGETDKYSFNIVDPVTKEPCETEEQLFKHGVHVRDLHATILHLLGFDHQKLSYRFQGLDQKLTGVLPARVVHEILA